MKRRPGGGKKRMKPTKQLEKSFASFTSFKGEKRRFMVCTYCGTCQIWL